jgi:DNA-binding PucR family transcriptional regulator
VAGLAVAATAYRQAALARRTLPPGCGEIATLDDRLPEALLLGSPELAQRLAARWLGPLTNLPAAEQRLLLGTLHAWLATGGSAIRTAEAVHCHRNTVLNRLTRLRSLTGHDFSAGPVPLELSLALRAARLATPGLVPAADPAPAAGQGPASGPVPADGPVAARLCAVHSPASPILGSLGMVP